MKYQAFTLIESMIVIFIIGLLTVIGAIGFGKVSRQKALQQAASRVNSETSAVRDYSLFGKQINGKFPCGYGIAVKKDSSSVKEVYASGSEGVEIDRVSAMEGDYSCDELIDEKHVDLSESPDADPANLSLGNIYLAEILRIQDNSIVDSESDCLVVLFSAPRGKAYYCMATGDSCPPDNCLLRAFTEGEIYDSNFFSLTLKMLESGSNDLTCISLYPSGKTRTISDVDNCNP